MNSRMMKWTFIMVLMVSMLLVTAQNGAAEIIPISGNLNGNGDITGTFSSSTATFTFSGKTVNFGTMTDLPIVGDWDGDGNDEIGIYRPNNGAGQSEFHLITRNWDSLPTNAGAADISIQFGPYPSNIPIVGDWDGDGDDDVGGFYPGNNKFYLYLLNVGSKSATSYKDIQFGKSGDKPIVGDWDGDGDDDIGVSRKYDSDYRNNLVFYFDLDLTGDQSDLTPIEFGNNGDIAVIGDWDKNGDDDVGFYRAGSFLINPANKVPHDYVFLNNGITKVGVDLQWGGAISVIMHQGINLIDNHDTGRLAQVSFYGYDSFKWNPVQAGGTNNIASNLVTFNNEDNQIYTKVRPRDWITGALTDTYVEQWVSLTEQSVKVKYKFTYFGTNPDYIFREHEFPCAYINTRLYRLITYSGSNPWANAAVEQIPIAQTDPGTPNVRFKPTEYWASFVDDSNFGITLYSPDYTPQWGAKRFTCDTKPSFIGTFDEFQIIPGLVEEATEYYIPGNYIGARNIIYSLRDNPPIANAGTDKTATVGSAVTFDGSASTDDKGIVSYSWDFDQSNGITADATTKIASKTCTATGIYTVTLTVTDTAGQMSTDTLQVTVNPSSIDKPPVANAGADKTAIIGSSVTFDGSASTDDKGITSYSWDFDQSNGITADATTKIASKTYTAAGIYTVTLTVTDTAGQKSTDTLQVTVNPSSIDKPPVANAGADKTITVGSSVTFDGSASTDDKGIVSYSWDFDQSNGITADATTKIASKTYTSAGTYTVTLTVTDTAGQKETDTLQVIISSPTSTVSYTPTYDNRMRSDSPNTVLSTTTYLDIGKSAAIARDVMIFDLSSYKTTDTISKANLSLYWYYPAGAARTSETVIEIYRPVEWDPKYVTWNSRVAGTLWSATGGSWYDKNVVSQGTTPYASLTFPAGTVPGNKYYDFDVTQLVKEYVSGKYKNTGFFLKAKTESGNYIAFYSSEYSNDAMKPKLTITASSGSTSKDNPPVANAGDDKTTTVGSAVTLDASASTDDKGIASYSWDFDVSNGITADATTKIASKTYTATGIYTVTLTVTDTAGQMSTDTLQVTVNPSSIDKPPVANTGADKTAIIGSSVTFDGSASTDDKGITSYSWDFDQSNGITADATTKIASKTYTTVGTYNVTLTVTDTAGQKSSDTLQVVVSNSGSTVSHAPTYDNRLRSDSPTTVLSSSTYLDTGRSTATARDMMMFDLSGYKTTDTISKAILSLYWYYPAGAIRTSDTVVEVYRPVEWDSKYLTWNSRASGTLWSTAGGSWYDKNAVSQGTTPYASVTFPAGTVPDNKYYDFDVTQLVKEYVSGKYKNTGFFLKAKTESGNYIAFYSSEYSNDAMKPKLTITATSGSTTTDNPPVANAGADKTTTIGSVVTFDGSASFDDKGIASYSWDFDASNGITSEATGAMVTKTYTSAGTYTVTLTITDTAGQKATDTLQVVSATTTLSPKIGIAAGGILLNKTQPELDIYFQNLQQLGVTWVRWDIEWGAIEEERGTYNWEKSDKVAKTAKKYGIKQLAIIDIPPKWAVQEGFYDEHNINPPQDFEAFAYFAKQVALRYKDSTYGPIEYFEIWNEPNLGGNWYPTANAVNYAELLKLSYTAIKEVNPNAKVISGGLAMAVTKNNDISPVDFINSLYETGAKGYFDAISLHPYTYPAAPNSEKINWNGWKSIDSIREIMVKNGDSDKKIWITEYGAPTNGLGNKTEIWEIDYTDYGVNFYKHDYMSKEAQAEMFRQAIEFYYKTDFLDAFFAYTLFDDSKLNGTEGYFGLICENGTEKSAYGVINKALKTTSPTNTVSYTPTYDNRLRESSPTTVLSTTTYLDFGRSTSSSRDVLMFDLSAYKTTDIISKATLSLYWYYPAGATRTSDTVVEIYRPVEWDPKYVTWNNRASGTPWTIAGGSWYDKNAVAQGTSPYASITFPAGTVPGNKYYDFDVTQLVQEYVSGKYKNTGFFLKAKTESGNYIAFYSSEASNAAMRPKLTITR